jgi:cobalt-zinc-cadmium efflux system membrane fusion protein
VKLVVAALVLTWGLCAAAADLIPISPEQRSALGVETAALESSSSIRSAGFPARVAVPSAQLQVITAPQAGVVEVLLVAEGEDIREGQAVARIRSLRLLELQGEYLETRARYRLAAANYERDRELDKEGIIAQRRLQESRAAYQELSAAQARLRQSLMLSGMDEASLRDLEESTKLSSTLSVRAPFDAVVLEQLTTVGNGVELGDALYRIADLEPLWLEIHVPLALLGSVTRGQTVVVPDLDLSAEVISIGRLVHGADQGVLVRAVVSEGTERLRPGQFVQAQLAAGGGSSSFRVPVGAVVRSRGDSYVFVAREGGFEPVPVTVVGEEQEHLVIEAELPAASRVAVSGTAAIKAAWPARGE